MKTTWCVRWSLFVAAVTALSCFRSGGSGGGGTCGASGDAGISVLERSYAGTATETTSGRSTPNTRSTTVTVTRSGTQRVQLDLGGCTVTANVEGCTAVPTSGQTCSVDIGTIRLVSGSIAFGDGTLTADLRFSYFDGSINGTFEYRFSTTPTSSAGSASCRSVCEHGRRLGCRLCVSSNCEANCATRMFSPRVIELMLTTETCRVDFDGDEADQCGGP